MLPLLSLIQTVLPYLLVIWLTPFIIIAIKMVRRPPFNKAEEFSYAKNREFFSGAERTLLSLLEQAAGAKYRILAKVHAAEIISVGLMSDQSAWLWAVDQISSRTFDFVLCDQECLAIVCAIKLSDASSAPQREHEQDIFLERVCKAISLPLLHIIAPCDLSVSTLRQKIYSALNQSLETEAESSERPFSIGLGADAKAGRTPLDAR
jgi:hypothetical protein